MSKGVLSTADQRWAKYFEALRLRARNRDPVAEEALGAWYLEGRKAKAGVTILSRSAARGARLLTRAAAAGNVTAVFRLAVCFDFGEGVKRNPSTAAALYRRAARGGHRRCGNQSGSQLS